MKNKLAPLVIIGCNRVKLLKRLVFSLKKNKLSKRTLVYFFIDFNSNKKTSQEIISFLNNIDFFYKKKIILRAKKFGLKKNILSAIDYVFKFHEKIIVLEDDLEVSKNILEYFNKSLDKFKKNQDIYTIAGFSFNTFYDVENSIDNNLILSKRPSSWGWASWKFKWKKLNKKKIKNLNSVKCDYGNDLLLMSLKYKIGNFKSWAFEWTIKHINYKKYCVYPRYSYIKNNGDDKFSTNNFFKIKKTNSKFQSQKLNSYNFTMENKLIQNKFAQFYNQPLLLFFLKYMFFKLIIFKNAILK
jgi:hypothetical protein